MVFASLMRIGVALFAIACLVILGIQLGASGDRWDTDLRGWFVEGRPSAEILSPAQRSEVTRDVQDGLKAEPLSSLPLIVHALLLAPQDTEQVRLAVARDKRDVTARLLLAQRLIEQERFDDTIGVVDALIRVDRDGQTAYLDVLLELVESDAGRERMLAALADGPVWRDAFLRELDRTRSGPPSAFVVRAMSTSHLMFDRFLRQTFDEGYRDLALMAWGAYTGIDTEELVWPFDSSFSGRDAPKPFNWHRNGRMTELGPDGGLIIYHRGRGKTLYANQTMRLKPGNYRFSGQVSGEVDADAGSVVVELVCVPSGDRAFSVDSMGAELRTGIDFEVPPSTCPYQRLSIRGEPGNFTGDSRVVVEGLEISPAG